MSETASEYDYEINPEDLEKIFAKTQTLDEKEPAAVTGGNEEDGSDYGVPDNNPYEDLTEYEKDALLYDPDTNCYFNHWCAMTFLHTETDRTDVECFKNYDCVWFSN